jgi:hypothetical protein
MTRSAFPPEFSALLTARARAALEAGLPRLAGALADPARPFVVMPGCIAPAAAARGLAALEHGMRDVLAPLAAAIPPESIWNQTRSFQERLPKVARMRSAYLGRRGSRAWARAEAAGVIAMLGSGSLRRLGEVLTGRRLSPRIGRQVLCYGPGDYIGPHHDHHPDIPGAREGYLDIHLSFATPAVRRQTLVYARDGHLTETVEVARQGLITAYRLPFWHYTTPLEARHGRAAEARRWVLLASYQFAG